MKIGFHQYVILRINFDKSLFLNRKTEQFIAGHFTQLVWRTSRDLGVGISSKVIPWIDSPVSSTSMHLV